MLARQFLCSGKPDHGRDPSEKELCSHCSATSAGWCDRGWGRKEQLLLRVVRGQEQPVRDSCTALEMVLLERVLFLHCNWDTFCPSFWRQRVTVLSFTYSEKHVYSLVFFKSQWYWLKPYLRICPCENWNFPNVRIRISSFWQYCSLVSTNFKESTWRCWAVGALGSG